MHIDYFSIIEILGTFSFAAAGALAAMEKKLDPFGVLIIGFATAIGGGTIRDILIGELPVGWLNDTTAILVIIIATGSALLFGSHMKKLRRMLLIFDAMGLGLFTMIGIQTGITHHLTTGICIMLGTVTGCFGGVLRDVLLNTVPMLFQKEIYAVASILGGLLFFLMLRLGITERLAYSLCIIFTLLIRMLAVRFNWSLPKFYLKSNNSQSRDEN